jgi:Tol biopolymer transport system component
VVFALVGVSLSGTGAAAAVGSASVGLMGSGRPGVLPPDAFTGSATISPDGRYIAYNLNDVPPGRSFVRDLGNGAVSPLGVNALFSTAAFTADDGLLAYTLGNLHGGEQVVYNIASGQVDTDLGGLQMNWARPLISADGGSVAYTEQVNESYPPPPAPFRYDRHSHHKHRIGGDSARWWGYPAALSADGHLVLVGTSQSLLPGDTNSAADVYSRDLRDGRMRLVSATPAGHAGDGTSAAAALSGDGRFALFNSDADDLVPGDTNHATDTFVRDLYTGRTRRISVSSTGAQADAPSGAVGLSADGRIALFTSNATNLVTGDTKGYYDAFAHDLRTGRTWRISTSSGGAQANHSSAAQAVTADGRYALFISTATNLISPPTFSGGSYLYRRDLHTGTVTRLNTLPDS